MSISSSSGVLLPRSEVRSSWEFEGGRYPAYYLMERIPIVYRKIPLIMRTCELMMPSWINLPFRRLAKSRRQVGYVLLTRAPVAISLSKLRPCCIDNEGLTGRVETDNRMTWAARSADGSFIPQGAVVRIVGQESVKLIVERKVS